MVPELTVTVSLSCAALDDTLDAASVVTVGTPANVVKLAVADVREVSLTVSRVITRRI